MKLTGFKRGSEGTSEVPQGALERRKVSPAMMSLSGAALVGESFLEGPIFALDWEIRTTDLAIGKPQVAVELAKKGVLPRDL